MLYIILNVLLILMILDVIFCSWLYSEFPI